MASFHERLVQLRKDRKLTQQQLATALEIHTRGLQNYESGRVPDPSILLKIADFFDVSLDYLMGRTDESNPRVPDDAALEGVAPEEAEFLRWVEDNLEAAFFYDFDKSPEDSKRQLMEDLRYLWEREKKQRERK